MFYSIVFFFPDLFSPFQEEKKLQEVTQRKRSRKRKKLILRKSFFCSGKKSFRTSLENGSFNKAKSRQWNKLWQRELGRWRHRLEGRVPRHPARTQQSDRRSSKGPQRGFELHPPAGWVLLPHIHCKYLPITIDFYCKYLPITINFNYKYPPININSYYMYLPITIDFCCLYLPYNHRLLL